MTKVFLADDEIVIREGIRNSFPWHKTEYQLVGEAPDGEIALSMIRDTKPDILITDIRMPFMDGLELCRIVRQQMPWIGIIILSGYDEFEYARQAIQLGVKEYLLKPITAHELQQVLDRVNAQLLEEQANRGRGILPPRKEKVDLFVKEKLLSTLYAEDAAANDAADVVRQLRTMGVLLTASRYIVVDAAFSPRDLGLDALRELADSSGGIAHVSGNRTGGRVLLLGDNDRDAEERAYSFASSAITELEKTGCTDIRISIGETVSSPEEIVNSMKSAAHIRHVLGDHTTRKPLIVGVRDFGESADGGSTRTVVARAKLFITEHFSDSNLMLKDVSDAVGMSESRFSTVFSQESGQTFTEYLTWLRLSRAKDMLARTDMKSAQIAFEVGYNDAHYFSYLFKKNVGMPPGEYRSKNQNQLK